MPFQRFRFELAGDVQYSRAFDALAREVDDLTEPLGRVGDHLLESIGEQFRTEGAHSGAKWKLLDPAYERWKDSAFPGRPILVRTGRMRGELLSHGALRVNPQKLVYRPDSDIALIHQQGQGHMPERKMVALTEGDRRSVDRIFSEWLTALRRGILGAR